MGDVAVHIG